MTNDDTKLEHFQNPALSDPIKLKNYLTVTT